MIIRDKWKEPTSHVTYTSTGKDPPPYVGREEQAYWLLAGQIESKFGSEPVTVSRIYHEVTGPLGLTSSDTIQLVRAAKKEGYLK